MRIRVPVRNLHRARSSRHLLPTGSTGELMFIDGGIGVRLKNLTGEEQDEWMDGVVMLLDLHRTCWTYVGHGSV